MLLERIEYTAQSVVCRAEIQNKSGFILDSSYDRMFRDFLFAGMAKEVRIKDGEGVLEFNSSVFSKIKADNIESKILKVDSSNTAILYNDQYFFKFYRKIEKRSILILKLPASFLRIQISKIVPSIQEVSNIVMTMGRQSYSDCFKRRLITREMRGI